ncbi:MAG: threonine/serine exporter family protein, partial [Deltaproteobacteria bacterium]|nr:threonine/serine exporter family protein [Deltaproteobacteria bacterium]
APPVFGRVVTVVSFGWVSALAALLFGGGLPEAGVAGVAGALIGALQVMASSRGLAGLLEAGSAAVAAFVAATVASVWPHSAEIAVLSALIVLVPGFTIHRALTDLSTGHLLSGSSRMAHAGTVLLLMGFGVALGGRAAGALVGVADVAEPVGLPGWQRTAALLAMTPALRVLFRAPRRSWLWIAAAVSIAWFGAMAGSELLGPDLGPFLGALALGLYALLWERIADRPAALPLAPGLLVLVPGAIGFRGVAALLSGDPLRAVETGFSALLVATSLVTGLLLANVLARGGVRRGVVRGDPA